MAPQVVLYDGHNVVWDGKEGTWTASKEGDPIQQRVAGVNVDVSSIKVVDGEAVFQILGFRGAFHPSRTGRLRC